MNAVRKVDLWEEFVEEEEAEAGKMLPVICCDEPTYPIYNAEMNQHRGWWCPHCNGFDKATGRETKFPIQAEVH